KQNFQASPLRPKMPPKAATPSPSSWRIRTTTSSPRTIHSKQDLAEAAPPAPKAPMEAREAAEAKAARAITSPPAPKATGFKAQTAEVPPVTVPAPPAAKAAVPPAPSTTRITTPRSKQTQDKTIVEIKERRAKARSPQC